MSEAVTPEIVDDAVQKALVTHREELAKIPGAAVFMTALKSVLDDAEAQVSVCLRGYKTMLTSAQKLTERKIEDEDHWKSCVALSIEAGDRRRKAEESFEMSTQFAYRFHRSLTAIRGLASEPWKIVSDQLEKHAKVWWLAREREKKEVEEKLAKAAVKEKTALELQAEELAFCGRTAEAEALLRQASLASMPVSLPEANPKVEGAKTTPKWKVECTDITAVMKAIVEGKFPLMNAVKVRGKKDEMQDRPLVTVDQVVLNALADRMGPELCKRLPGVTVTPDVSFSGTGRK